MPAMLLLLLLSVAPHAPALAGDSLPDRVARLGLSAEALFHPPRDAAEERFFRAGLLHFWQQYGGDEEPRPDQFRGYILYGDPFHAGLGRVSFLLGADCSGFVHRLLQLLGARYPYAKTRHLIHVAEFGRAGGDPEAYYRAQAARGAPVDLTPCRWRELTAGFRLVPDGEPAASGDIAVFTKARGDRGARGHVALVRATGPDRILHAKGRAEGIVEEPLSAYPAAGRALLRWRGELAPLAGERLGELLAAAYDDDPSHCR